MLNSSFPRAMLPIAAVYKGLLGLVPAMAIYLVIHLALGQPFGAGLATLPFLLAIHTVLEPRAGHARRHAHRLRA